jgi:hypothetical protein
MRRVFIIMAVIAVFFVACTNYGTKKTYGKGELYYTENITEAEADSVGAFLSEIGYLNDETGVTVQVDKVDTVYKLRFVVKEEYHTNDSLDFFFKIYGNMASERVFGGKTVEVDLCDNLLKPQRTIK